MNSSVAGVFAATRFSHQVFFNFRHVRDSISLAQNCRLKREWGDTQLEDRLLHGIGSMPTAENAPLQRLKVRQQNQFRSSVVIAKSKTQHRETLSHRQRKKTFPARIHTKRSRNTLVTLTQINPLPEIGFVPCKKSAAVICVSSSPSSGSFR